MAEKVPERKPRRTISITLEKEGASLGEATNLLAEVGKNFQEAEVEGWEVTDYSVSAWK